MHSCFAPHRKTGNEAHDGFSPSHKSKAHAVRSHPSAIRSRMLDVHKRWGVSPHSPSLFAYLRPRSLASPPNVRTGNHNRDHSLSSRSCLTAQCPNYPHAKAKREPD